MNIIAAHKMQELEKGSLSDTQCGLCHWQIMRTVGREERLGSHTWVLVNLLCPQ